MCIHAAVEDRIGLFGLDRCQDCHKVGGLVVGEFGSNDLDTLGFRVLLEHVGQALAVGGTVVDHGDVLELERIGCVACQRSAQRVVVGDDTEHAWVGGAGQLRVGGRTGDERHAAVVEDLGRRNGHARVQDASHSSHLLVTQLLCCSSALLGIGGIVFGHHFKLDLLAANRHALGIEVLHGETHAGDIVLAVVGLWAGQRTHRTDLHHLLRASSNCHAGHHHCHCCFDTFVHCVVLHHL
ncbi:hypothetical protein D3C72_1633230 [compost metagenome]